MKISENTLQCRRIVIAFFSLTVVLSYFFICQNSVSVIRSLIIVTLVLFIIGYTMISELLKINNIYGTIASGAALGGLFFVSVLGIKIVDPTYTTWLMQGDWGTHFLGWHFFRNEPWSFPLGTLKSYQYPVGTAVALTDANPLMALIFKPFSPILPEKFQYIGIWLLLCFCLQGMFGAILIRTLTNNIIIQLLGAAFFVVSPIMLYRICHPTLCSHWLLLGSIWLYFRNYKKSSLFPDLGLWGFLVIISASVQPYITPMVMGLALAFYLRLVFIERTLTVKYSIFNISILIFSALTVWWLVGFLELGQARNYTARFDQGYFSMNLLAPIIPNPLNISESEHTWSIFLKPQSLARGGQYEGFNYLGVGVIVLGLWVFYALLSNGPKFKTIKSLLPLAFICLCFTLFALSVQVTIGDKIIFQYPTNRHILSILSIFRASGRFFWPVYYSLIFLIIAFFINRNNSLKKIAIILTIGLTLQVSDFHKIYDGSEGYYIAGLRQPPESWNNPLVSELWDAIGKNYDKIILVPPGMDEAAPYLPFSYLAANHKMAINTSYSSRYKQDKINEYSKQLLNDIKNGIIDSDSVYILTQEYFEILKNSAKVPVICGTIDGFNVCVSDQKDKPNPAIEILKEE